MTGVVPSPDIPQATASTAVAISVPHVVVLKTELRFGLLVPPFAASMSALS
jgi:hypothetical protein